MSRHGMVSAGNGLFYPFWIISYEPKDPVFDEMGYAQEHFCLAWSDGLITDLKDEDDPVEPGIELCFGYLRNATNDLVEKEKLEDVQRLLDSGCIGMRDRLVEDGFLVVLGHDDIDEDKGFMTCGRGVIADYACAKIVV